MMRRASTAGRTKRPCHPGHPPSCTDSPEDGIGERRGVIGTWAGQSPLANAEVAEVQGTSYSLPSGLKAGAARSRPVSAAPCGTRRSQQVRSGAASGDETATALVPVTRVRATPATTTTPPTTARRSRASPRNRTPNATDTTGNR